MHRVLLRAKSVRFHSTKATSAEAKKPSRSLWPTAIGSAVAAYVAFEAWKRWDDDEKNPARVFHRLPGEKTEEEKKLASEPQMFLLHLVSYRTISRLWGAVNEIELPTFLREPIYNAWTKAFDCKLDEMKYPLEHYKNLSEFFSRPLKDGIRPINWDPRCMSSPVDGTMATYGVVDFTDDIPVLEQIKGVRYRMDEFLGAVPDFFLAPPSPGKKLFHCVIYLAPGDYHRIHSPIDWSMGERRHFPGDLWPVNKIAVTSVPSLFTWNERVALLGRWKHGFFSMSLVGATNVGSMTLDVEPDFATNKALDFYLTKEWGSCDTKKYESQQLVTRGDQVAQFKLGSTVVLVFEAPEDFKFTAEPGDKVRYGASIGHFERAADADGSSSTFPSTSEMIRLANQGSDEKTSYLGEISRSISQAFFGPRKASADLQAEKSEPIAKETNNSSADNMRRQVQLVAVVAVCALFSVHGALLKDAKTRHLDAMYADGKAADGCVWKRVWRGDTADLAVSDELPFVKRNVKMEKGPTFGIQTSSGENGTIVSGRASFPLDLDSFPTAGKLVMSATLPRAQGLRPLVRLVKTRSDGHQDELIVIEGSSMSQSGLALRSSGFTKELPCIKGLSQGFHEYVVAWDASWVRWYVDGSVYVETHVSSFFTSPDDAVSLSLVAEVQIDATYSRPSAQMDVHELLLYKQTSDACVPTLSNPSLCNQTSNEPLIPALRSGSLLGSLTLDELHEFIDDELPKLMAPFPHLWRREIIGQTIEDRPIVALCFGVCHLSADETVPQALYTGLHHSREPMSMMNLVFFIDHLILGLTAQNAAITQLLHARQLWFVLVVNPDGYVYNEQTIANSGTLAESFSGQRKNRNGAKCRSDPQLGVDLNRNYDVCFDQDSVGSSNKGCAEDYRGSSAFSEPETVAIRRLVEKNAFSAALNYHSFGQYFNIPFACQPKGTPDTFSSDVYTMLATEMTSLNHFKFGQSWKESNLYSVNGEASDWMWNAHGIYAMSPEVGPEFHLSTFRGFWPSDSDKIHTICEELLHSNYVLAAYSGPLYHVEMERWESMDKNRVRLHLLVSNRGLRRPKGLEAVASIHMNGTASGPVETVDILSASDPNNDVVSVVLAVPNADTLAYVVLRDGFSCYMYRVSLGTDPSVFQLWQPLLQPQCGACATFGAPSSINPGLNCSLIDAVTVEEDHPVEKTSKTMESHQDSLRASSKHKAPMDENKALLLISLVVLLGMVVALIGMRHAKQSNSSADDYAMVAKTERDAVEEDNMLPLDSPMVSPGPIQGIDDEASLLHGDGSASQLRVRSPPPPTQYPSSEEV